MQLITDDFLETLHYSVQPLLGEASDQKIEALPDGSDSFVWTGLDCSEGWSGTIATGYERDLLNKAAMRMFGKTLDEISDQDRADVASEIVNIIAGNVLPLLGPNGSISTPSTFNPQDLAGAEVVSVLIDGHWLTLALRD